MKVELIDHMGSDLSCVNAARVSMNKESNWEYDKEEVYPGSIDEGIYYGMNPRLSDKDAKLITYLAKNQHYSCFEHQVITLRLKVPLFIARQIQRHRTFSYNEISRRYVKDELEFYWPSVWRQAAENVKQGSSDNEIEVPSYARDCYESAIDFSVQMYNGLLDLGLCTEIARAVLPTALYTQFYMTGNLRNWCHFLKLRLDKHAQKEVQEVAQLVAQTIQPLYPISYKALMNEA